MVDPHLKEETAAAGTLSCVVNNGRQLCCLDKQGGEGLTMSQVPLWGLSCTAAGCRCPCGACLVPRLSAGKSWGPDGSSQPYVVGSSIQSCAA